MTTPAIVFCFLVSALYGSVFHLIRGGNFFTLIVFILVATGGFFLGHYIATLISLEFVRIGSVNFGVASIVSVIALIISGLISRPIR